MEPFEPHAGTQRAVRKEADGHAELAYVPTSELVKELAAEARALVREEAQAVQGDLRERMRGAARGGAIVGAGMTLGHAALLAAVAALGFALAMAMPAWAAALVTGAVAAVAGYALVRIGAGRAKDVKLDDTVRRLKEDGRWASETMHAVRRARDSE